MKILAGLLKYIGIIIAAAALGVSIFALVKSCESNNISKSANDLSEKANQQVNQINLPIISVYSSLESPSFQTEKITIMNEGGKLSDIPNVSIHTLISLFRASDSANITYLELSDYLGPANESYTSDVTNQLYSSQVQDNYFKWNLINASFTQQANQDFNNPVFITKKIIIEISYNDVFNDNHIKYFYLDQPNEPAQEINSEGFNAILSLAKNSANIAAQQGIILSIDKLDGSALYKWYKANIPKR